VLDSFDYWRLRQVGDEKPKVVPQIARRIAEHEVRSLSNVVVRQPVFGVVSFQFSVLSSAWQRGTVEVNGKRCTVKVSGACSLDGFMAALLPGFCSTMAG